ncbi:flagellar type III secretion system protein FlhB [Allosphingosinicella sp.]|uniref:flagellar type III secretion system protein FlhB n=1 Tax=Allosphingosinicella sp. TaxID=2823234 RepID=UPI003782E259
MSGEQDQDQKTEAPTPKRRREAAENGDVLQSRELGTALVILVGAAWIALAGPMLMSSLQNMLTGGLSFSQADVSGFDPGQAILRLLGAVALPVLILFALTMVAAVAAPAVLGSLGFRTSAFAFKGNKLNPLSGFKRMFGLQGLIELVKSIAKVALLGGVGAWLIFSQTRNIVGLSAQDINPALANVGHVFTVTILVMAGLLALIALIDVPAQILQRMRRLRMTKQEIKDEHKQTEGSPELKGALRRRQLETARNSARKAMAEATMVLTNPTHFAVALRYRPEIDAAPVVVAKGRGATAEAIRELAGEHNVPMLSYPQLTRALYYTSRPGQIIREDLYMAVATILAFVFNLEQALASGQQQPDIEVPTAMRFDTSGLPEV